MASTTAAKALCLLAFISLASATAFNVVNGCGTNMDVFVSPPIGVSRFTLSNGQSRTLLPPNGWNGRFAYGGTGSLLAEFSINMTAGRDFGRDFYDLSAVDGFVLDHGMTISISDISGEIKLLTCSASRSICPPANVQGNNCVNPNPDDPNSGFAQSLRANCLGAFTWSGDNLKTHFTSTGGTFTITLCPSESPSESLRPLDSISVTLVNLCLKC